MDVAFCLAHTALFARLKFKLEVALEVQKGSLYQLNQQNYNQKENEILSRKVQKFPRKNKIHA